MEVIAKLKQGYNFFGPPYTCTPTHHYCIS